MSVAVYVPVVTKGFGHDVAVGAADGCPPIGVGEVRGVGADPASRRLDIAIGVGRRRWTVGAPVTVGAAFGEIENPVDVSFGLAEAGVAAGTGPVLGMRGRRRNTVAGAAVGLVFADPCPLRGGVSAVGEPCTVTVRIRAGHAVPFRGGAARRSDAAENDLRTVVAVEVTLVIERVGHQMAVVACDRRPPTGIVQMNGMGTDTTDGGVDVALSVARRRGPVGTAMTVGAPDGDVEDPVDVAIRIAESGVAASAEPVLGMGRRRRNAMTGAAGRFVFADARPLRGGVAAIGESGAVAVGVGAGHAVPDRDGVTGGGDATEYDLGASVAVEVTGVAQGVGHEMAIVTRDRRSPAGSRQVRSVGSHTAHGRVEVAPSISGRCGAVGAAVAVCAAGRDVEDAVDVPIRLAEARMTAAAIPILGVWRRRRYTVAGAASGLGLSDARPFRGGVAAADEGRAVAVHVAGAGLVTGLDAACTGDSAPNDLGWGQIDVPRRTDFFGYDVTFVTRYWPRPLVARHVGTVGADRDPGRFATTERIDGWCRFFAFTVACGATLGGVRGAVGRHRVRCRIGDRGVGNRRIGNRRIGNRRIGSRRIQRRVVAHDIDISVLEGTIWRWMHVRDRVDECGVDERGVDDSVRERVVRRIRRRVDDRRVGGRAHVGAPTIVG